MTKFQAPSSSNFCNIAGKFKMPNIAKNATDGHPCPRYLANKFKMPNFSKGHNTGKNKVNFFSNLIR